MAKAQEIVGLDCAAGAAEWAGRILEIRFQEITQARGAALDFSDNKGVHAMRVAARRLRSALLDFAPLMSPKPLRKIKKNVKKIAAQLGAVRDEDVAVAALEKLQKKADDAIKPGIEEIIAERNQIRDSARLDLTEVLNVAHLANLQENFAPGIQTALKSRGSKTTFDEAGREAVAASFAEFWELGASLYQPFEIEEIHELRIAAKRLRYALELFAACWGEKITAFAAEIAEMQTHLGEVHDADVWIEILGQKLRTDANPAAIWLLSNFTDTRTKHYVAALKLWGKWQETDFSGRMNLAIQN